MPQPPLTQEQMLEVHRLWNAHGRSVRAAAQASGLSYNTYRSRLESAKATFGSGGTPGAEKPRIRVQVARGARPPLSEDQGRFHEEWGPDECVEELRRIALANPEKALTRNFFRNESQISEATWNRYFGTFEEFLRQAGVKLSRHAHRLEKAVARHASVDEFRAMNADKAGWEGAYLRPDGKRFQTAVIGSDVHDIECHPLWRACFIDVIRRVQPEKVILNGDVFDLPEFGKYSVDPRTWDVVGRIQWVHTFLRDIREAAPGAEIVFVEGNHEYRLLRHLAEATPAMRAVLSDLHGFTVPKLLGLDTYQVNYIARMDLSAFTERDVKTEMARNYYIAWESLLCHHFPEGRQMGIPGVNGHHHKHQVWPFYSPRFGSTEWHQMGCGHRPAAEYCAGEKWAMGIMVAMVDTERHHVAFDYSEIKDTWALIGGRFYEAA